MFQGALADGLAGESWELYCWVVPGSGPVIGRLYAADCGNTVKGLFNTLSWQPGQGTSHAEGEGYSVDLFLPNARLRMYPDSNTVLYTPSQSGQGSLSFHASGAEKLCDALMALLPGPEARYFLSADKTMATYEEQAALFAKNFETAYRNSGVIADFRLDRAEFVTEEEEGYINRYLLFSYAVKPMNPTWQAWQAYSSQDGWVAFEHQITLYEDGDGYTRVFFFQ